MIIYNYHILKMSWNSRFQYPQVYTKPRICIYTNTKYSEEYTVSHNIILRKKLREYMKKTHQSFKDIIKNAYIHDIIYVTDIDTLQRDHTILCELPIAYKKRKEKLTEQRKSISKIAMRGIKRKNNTSGLCIPSDLVPLICEFAVPESKKWRYS